MYKNLTPHPIVVITDTASITYPITGNVARIGTITTVIGEIEGIPVVRKEYTEVEGLPDPELDVWYIVSGYIKEARPDRKDLVAPNTDATAVRDSDGNIIAVRNFVIERSR